MIEQARLQIEKEQLSCGVHIENIQNLIINRFVHYNLKGNTHQMGITLIINEVETKYFNTLYFEDIS